VERRPSSQTDTHSASDLVPKHILSKRSTGANFEQQAMDAMNSAREQAQSGIAAAAGVNTVSTEAFKRRYEQPRQEL